MAWGLISVELLVCAWILIMLGADLIRGISKTIPLWKLALIGIALCAILLIFQNPSGGVVSFSKMWVVDPFAVFFKWLFLITVAVVIIMTRIFSPNIPHNQGAFYLLLFTALLGMLVLASVNDLLMLFLGLELLTFSLYIMAAYLKSDPRSVEAGMKYLILGSVSTGFLIYGTALIYAFAGTLSFPGIRQAIALGPVTMQAKAGMLLILAGLGFKTAAVPFHMWVPDVYEGAPTPVVALLSVGSKMAGVMALLRILYTVFAQLQPIWTVVIAALSAATLLYGNLGAIHQTNIKRLLGYSSIGHAGYLLMGLSAGTIMGGQALCYYLLAYLFSNLAVFFVIIVATNKIGGENISDYAGLSKRSGILAGSMFIALLSLAGVPPLAGFFGKLLVLLATLESGRLWLVIIGALNVVISLYYYLMIVKQMYIDLPKSQLQIKLNLTTKIVLGILILGIFSIGIFQEPFLLHIKGIVSL